MSFGTPKPGTAGGEAEHQSEEQPDTGKIDEIHEHTPNKYCDMFIV